MRRPIGPISEWECEAVGLTPEATLWRPLRGLGTKYDALSGGRGPTDRVGVMDIMDKMDGEGQGDC